MDSKLSKIYYKNKEYREVNAFNLLNSEINKFDMVSINNLIKAELKKYTLISIYLTLFLLSSSYLLYDTLKTSYYKEIFLMIGITLGIFIALILTLKKIYHFKHNTCQKAQYGIVQHKYIIKNEASSEGINHYYINVVFPNTNTYIRKVICNKKVYNDLNEDCKVLVVSFDTNNAYAIYVCNSNKL